MQRFPYWSTFISALIKIIKNNVSLNSYKKKIIIGISIYNQNEYDIVEKILLANLSGYNKICFFSYNSIKNKNITFNIIKNNYAKRKYLLGD